MTAVARRFPSLVALTILAMPDVLQFEKAFPLGVVDALKAAGYKVEREGEFDEKSAGVWGDSELIAVDPKTGMLMGGQDKRQSFGKAAGY